MLTCFVLLLLSCLQSITTAQTAEHAYQTFCSPQSQSVYTDATKEPESCCVSLYEPQVPVTTVKEHEETTPCSTQSEIMNGKRVSEGPVDRSVTEAINQLRVEKKQPQEIPIRSRPNAKVPKSCCFNYYTRKIPMKYIRGYEETMPGCAKPGIIFILKRGQRICMDPSDQWVRKVVDRVNQRLVES